MQIHATCVSLDGQGVLLMGRSGCGKSDVALRLIDRGALLVADDQVILSEKEGRLYASCPETTKGFIEARYVGILRLPYEDAVPVALCIDFDKENQNLERLPKSFCYSFLDCAVSGLRLPSCEASTPAKIRLALQGSIMDV